MNIEKPFADHPRTSLRNSLIKLIFMHCNFKKIINIAVIDDERAKPKNKKADKFYEKIVIEDCELSDMVADFLGIPQDRTVEDPWNGFCRDGLIDLTVDKKCNTLDDAEKILDVILKEYDDCIPDHIKTMLLLNI